MGEASAKMGKRPNNSRILINASLRCIPSGLARKIAPGNLFVKLAYY